MTASIRAAPPRNTILRECAPRAAVNLDVVATSRHREQVDACTEERSRVENDVARDEHVDRPVGVACGGDGNQRHRKSR